jgi:CRP-like cAMP-binding protein
MPSEKKQGNHTLLEFEPGEIVMEQGRLARGLYVLMNGALEVDFEGVKVAEIRGKGAFVGEIASLLGGRRIATVRASEPSRMLHFENVTQYFEQNPASALLIAKTLASRIMEMNKKIAGFQNIAENWIEVGKDAVRRDDVGPIREALADMQEVFVKQIQTG